MADPNSGTYRLNINRNKTQKWQTAKQPTYGGGWGDSDEEDEYDAPPALPTVSQSASAASRQPSWVPNATAPSQRSFTNPVAPAVPNVTRRSFDDNDDGHLQSSGAAPADEPRDPFTTQGHGPSHLPLHLHMQVPPTHLHAANPVVSHEDIGSQSNAQTTAQHATNNMSGQQSSTPLSTSRHITIGSAAIPQETSNALPFVRPADIYKRMEEEREKERRSQDITRPNVDSTSRSIYDDPISATQATQLPGSASSQSHVQRDANQLLNSSQSTASGGIRSYNIASEKREHSRDSAPQPLQTSKAAVSAQTGAFETDNLQRQPSLGYQSVVHKAFDNEAHDVLSPSTTTESLPRSGSASTTDISPIIARRVNSVRDVSLPSGLQTETINEESSLFRGRPESSSTIKPSTTSSADKPLEPPVVPPGFRRDSNSPSPANSPARRPLSVVTPTLPGPEQGVLSTVTSRTSTEDPLSASTPIAPAMPSHTQGTLLPAAANSSSTTHAISRSASEDWQEWKEQRRSFHAKHGTEETSSASPGTSPPISRTESVSRDIVPTVSGAPQHQSDLSPVPASTKSEHFPAPSRPVQQTRLESFRPVLPGGWQSDTTIGSSDRREDVIKSSQPPYIQAEDRTDSLESVPTATAPKSWSRKPDGAIESAFAAAAAAGSAMVGAFSGSHSGQDTSQDSESDSENEAYPGNPAGSVPAHSATRDFASSPEARPLGSGPMSATLPASGDGVAAPGVDERQQAMDYPAPLRTTRSIDSRGSPSRASMLSPSVSTGFEDPEQLQHDIVQSLTPKASTIDRSTISAIPTMQEPEPVLQQQPEPVSQQQPEPVLQHQREDSVGSYDPAIEQAYSSYWQDTPTIQTTVHEQVTSTDLPNAEPAKDLTTQQHQQAVFSQTTGAAGTGLPSNPPLLEQRFSWEDRKASTTPQQITTQKPEEHRSPLTPTLNHDRSQGGLAKDAAEFDNLNKSTESATPELIDDHTRTSFSQAGTITGSYEDAVPMTVTNNLVASSAAFPRDAIDFRSIMGYENSHQRIRAFDDNRRIHAEPNGLLDNWLASMNTPEHASTFAHSQQIRPLQQASQNDSTPVRRESHLPGGTKQIQEDGKRLLAAAGKYGGKAGIAAKGLFARGKEKLRTASAGDKVPVTHRRRSTQDEISTASSPRSQRSDIPVAPVPTNVPRTSATPTSSIVPQRPTVSTSNSAPHRTNAFAATNAPQMSTVSTSANAPQLPTPVEEVSWSLISSTIDQYFQDPSSPQSRNPSLHGQRLSQLGIRGELTRKDRKRTDSLPSNTKISQSTDNTTVSTPKVFTASPTQVTDTSFLASPSPDTQTGTQDDAFGSNSQQSTPRAPNNDRGSKPLPAMPALQLLQQEEASQARRRRPSSVSEVSEMSRDHDPDDTTSTLARVVSPPPGPRINPRSQEVPIYLSKDVAKGVESRGAHESIPGASGAGVSSPRPTAIEQNTVHSKIAPGTKIVPVADLKTSKQIDARTSDRPFSFVGAESSALSSKVGGGPPPISPDSSDEQQNELDEKNLEPNLREHPAYRHESGQKQDSTANPLPSSRRPAEELERVRQQRLQQPKRTEEPQQGYVIPGPYVQEYRPPKPKNSADQLRNYGKSPVVQTEAINTPTMQSENHVVQASTDDFIPEAHGRTNMPTANRAERTNGLTLGGFFRPRSESRGQLDHPDFVSAVNGTAEDRKRKVFFRLNSGGRGAGSPNHPQYMQQEKHDGVASTPYDDRRKTSGDMFKLKGLGNRVSTDGKKRRMSALAGLFSRSNNKDKSRSSTSMSQYPDFDYNQQRPGAQSAMQMASSAPSGGTESREYSMHSPYSLYPQAPQDDGRSGSLTSARPDLSGFPKPPRQKTWRNTSGEFAQSDNLRLDTRDSGMYGTGGQPGSASTPYATASAYPATTGSTHMSGFSSSPTVPTTYAPRDISYGQEIQYVPSSSPSKAASAGPGNINSHVKNLNKRSRSPRLGRPPSDEVLHGPYSANADKLEPEPVQQLGTFNNKKAGPVGGRRSEQEQEKPWTLTLPGGGDVEDDEQHMAQRGRHSRNNSIQHSPPQKYAQPAHDSSQDSIQSENMLSVRPQQSIRPTRLQPSTSPRDQYNLASHAMQSQVDPSPKDRDAVRQAQIRGQRYMDRTPSPFLSSGDVVSQDSNSLNARDHAYNNQSEIRSTTPITNPPTGVQPYTIGNATANNRGTSGASSTKPQTSIVHGNTITTTMTVKPGVNTRLVTKIDPPANVSSHTPPQPSQVQPSTPVQSPSHSQAKHQNLRSPTTPISNQRLASREEFRSPAGVSPYKPIVTPPSALTNLRTPDRNSGMVSPNQAVVTPQTVAREKPRASSRMEESHPAKIFAPVELPGSKPDGYESEEEPIMSATAYPGQEWMPAWDRWED